MSRPIDTARYLGRCQGRHLARYDDAEALRDRHPGVPYVRVTRDADLRYRVEGGGHAGHDNEDRMPIACKVLETRVLPRLPGGVDVSGYYALELHDSYSYLDRRPASDYAGAMCFSKRRTDVEAVCVPDMYQLLGYGGRRFSDPYAEFETKLDAVVGAYTTTGDRRPDRNVRVQTCLWSLQNRDRAHLYITNVAQMTPDALFGRYPQLVDLRRAFVPPSEQQRYKFLLNLPGNTETWDMAWMLASNSLVLKRAHPDMCWYSPLLLDGTHVAVVESDEDILPQATYYGANPRETRFVIQGANRFVRDFLVPPDVAYDYWAALWEASWERSGK